MEAHEYLITTWNQVGFLKKRHRLQRLLQKDGSKIYTITHVVECSSYQTLLNSNKCLQCWSIQSRSSAQQRLSTPRLLTQRYLTPLYGLTPSPKPRLRRWSMLRPSTLIPEGSQPRTENETDAEFGIRLALTWALVLRAGRDVDGAKNAGRWEFDD